MLWRCDQVGYDVLTGLGTPHWPILARLAQAKGSAFPYLASSLTESTSTAPSAATSTDVGVAALIVAVLVLVTGAWYARKLSDRIAARDNVVGDERLMGSTHDSNDI